MTFQHCNNHSCSTPSYYSNSTYYSNRDSLSSFSANSQQTDEAIPWALDDEERPRIRTTAKKQPVWVLQPHVTYEPVKVKGNKRHPMRRRFEGPTREYRTVYESRIAPRPKVLHHPGSYVHSVPRVYPEQTGSSLYGGQYEQKEWQPDFCEIPDEFCQNCDDRCESCYNRRNIRHI